MLNGNFHCKGTESQSIYITCFQTQFGNRFAGFICEPKVRLQLRSKTGVLEREKLNSIQIGLNEFFIQHSKFKIWN